MSILQHLKNHVSVRQYADATISLAAVDPCYCCTERMAVAYDLNSGDKIMNANELINESVKRTNELKKTIKSQTMKEIIIIITLPVMAGLLLFFVPEKFRTLKGLVALLISIITGYLTIVIYSSGSQLHYLNELSAGSALSLIWF